MGGEAKVRFVTSVMLLVVCLLCSAQTTVALNVDVIPSLPTLYDPVTIEAWRTFPNTGQAEVETTYTISDYQIDVTVVMEALPVWLEILTDDGGSADVGALDPGLYGVDAEMLMIPAPGMPPVPYDSGSTSFYVPIPGDADRSMKVDIIDLTVVAANWSSMPPNIGIPKDWSEGDFSNDQIVDIVDLTALSAYWSFTFIGDPPPVPEPACAVLLLLGAGWVVRRRRERKAEN